MGGGGDKTGGGGETVGGGGLSAGQTKIQYRVLVHPHSVTLIQSHKPIWLSVNLETVAINYSAASKMALRLDITLLNTRNAAVQRRLVFLLILILISTILLYMQNQLSFLGKNSNFVKRGDVALNLVVVGSVVAMGDGRFRR